ncbi:MAG: cyclic nucleotide-binding domain-containing protein [Polyangiaceae bacterium]
MLLDLIERAIFLRRTAIGRELPDAPLRVVAEVARELVFPAGSVMAFEGEPGQEMFLVVSGRVEVRKLGARPAPTARRGGLGLLVGYFEADAVLGEMAALDDERRSATMVAETEVVALAVQTGDHRHDARIAALRGGGDRWLELACARHAATGAWCALRLRAWGAPWWSRRRRPCTAPRPRCSRTPR